MTANQDVQSPLPFLHVAVPVLDEPELLPRLLTCIRNQSYRSFRLYICVNQPEIWWKDPEHKVRCERNAATLKMLANAGDAGMVVLDHASPGKGWKGKRHGVGWARKTLMDAISEVADPGHVVISLDADTTFGAHYFQSVAGRFKDHPGAVALAVPYFHKLTGDPEADRAILRYEIYMRHYLLNLYRIGSPFNFTALGSAMAFPVWAYRAIGGMTPKMSGEDFYFLQKLAKFGPVLKWIPEVVYPEARFSDRVFFGTGPAMIRGRNGDWTSYPVYDFRLFDEIMETYLLLPLFQFGTPGTAVSRFMAEIAGEPDPWQPLRENHKDPERFARAFHEKFDGLRILQYIKSKSAESAMSDEQNLRAYLENFFEIEEYSALNIDWAKFSFDASPIGLLDKIRVFLYEREMTERASSEPL